MSWFFGSRHKDEDSEYTSEEYTSSEGEDEDDDEVSDDDEEVSDEEDDDHSDDDEDEEHAKLTAVSEGKAAAPAAAEGPAEKESTPPTTPHLATEEDEKSNQSKQKEEVPATETPENKKDPAADSQPSPSEQETSSNNNNNSQGVAAAVEDNKESKVENSAAAQESQENGGKTPSNKETNDQNTTITKAQDKTDKKDTTKKQEEEEEEEEEEVTSIHEKRSLLVLAAEHDRVDILKAILSDDCEDRDELLNGSIPPLHIALTYGSTNAVTSLLRMGADPSIRPNVSAIQSGGGGGDQQQQQEPQLVDIPNMGRFDGLSAWELAFGKEEKDDDNEKQQQKQGKPIIKKRSSSWFGGSDKKKSTLDIAPSKLEGIRHAFTAEALRCIGSDEVDRLKQLRDSGMPSTIDIGGKNLYDWAVEMSAEKCEKLLQPAGGTAAATDNDTDKNGDQQQQQPSSSKQEGTSSSAVLDRSRPGTETLPQLSNRIDELESLAKALSTCLDNLAEEVSVCHGLLLMGGGASALASHVRSLKSLKENKLAELERLEEAWEQGEDELAYWIQQCGDQGKEIAELMSPALISTAAAEIQGEEAAVPFSGTPEEEKAQMHQLKAQAALLENKVRKLRASITDLSEENTRDLEEVEKRGLSGGIKLVRTLRDELREVEFTLNETRSAEALCRAKIKWVQSKVGAKQHKTKDDHPVEGSMGNDNTETPASRKPASAVENGHSSRGEHQPLAAYKASQPPQPSETSNSTPDNPVSQSEAIASGQSTAVTLHRDHTSGYFTVELWKILLRIIGLGGPGSQRATTAKGKSAGNSKPPPAPASSSSNVMLV